MTFEASSIQFSCGHVLNKEEDLLSVKQCITGCPLIAYKCALMLVENVLSKL